MQPPPWAKGPSAAIVSKGAEHLIRRTLEEAGAPPALRARCVAPPTRLACALRGAATRLGSGLDFCRAGSQGYNHGKPAHAAGAGLVVDRLDELAVRLGLTAGPAT